MLRECFQLSLQYKHVYSFKGYAAKYYKRGYDELVRELTSGPLIHADETSMKITKTPGYVWVFAGITEAIYMFKSTRNGAFLKELLCDFDGVLVSDFYSAYDGVDCRQQKCLVHLIWDINTDLRLTPGDLGLRSLAEAFRELLKKIISTIDRFGLKARYLRKHKHDVSRFFSEIEMREHTSDISLHYTDRLRRYRGKLFTFLEEDGIPWNNNMAENAIKKVAKFRRASLKHTMVEHSLDKYLVLLSLSVTCEYRGVSFLRFLLSGEKSIDAYCDNL